VPAAGGSFASIPPATASSLPSGWRRALLIQVVTSSSPTTTAGTSLEWLATLSDGIFAVS
jgi:hypothetical protein